mmetsp:Transcript_34346/g.38355  ORF Transcript_34346/g.38355 Transcript_34346/m.38355 type:complete len:112 (-) Transcript_34346:519-854(-)
MPKSKSSKIKKCVQHPSCIIRRHTFRNKEFKDRRHRLLEEVGRQRLGVLVRIGSSSSRRIGILEVVTQEPRQSGVHCHRKVYEPTIRRAFRSCNSTWPKYRSIASFSYDGM